ncbi:MAG: Ig-like domain-containing protein [Verrucomicrobia bacterium]|nr:Ig-like domain-containing protein [Verrucomicrobiota bacterium]
MRASTITNPANGARWSNAVISVRGTATDDGQIQAVYFQCNEDTNIYTAVGTNVWAADFPGIPGTNTITAYAVDGFGNQSTNATRKIFYVVPSPFTLVIAGKGTVSSNWTGTNLEIGRIYRMTMTGPGSGYRFAGWSGGVTASTTSIDFMMQSNLVIQANFADVYSPTFAITNPAVNMIFSNSPAVSVSGTVTDNSGAAEVRYRLNGGAWSVAAGTTTPWHADLVLPPGTNVFSAYAVDSTGNASTTNSLNLIYWLFTPLAIHTNGQGAVNPNYDGQPLVIGKSYSTTATGTNGYKFLNWVVSTNWDGGAANTNAALTFLMQSNLTVLAVFQDTNRPALTITNPAANSRFTNTTVNVQGTIADNAPGAAVYWRLGTNAWAAVGVAETAGTNQWTIPVNPVPGTNIFSAHGVDAAGNHSPTNSLSFIYSGDFAVLAVQTNGQGTVTPNYDGQSLGIGQTFTLTAAGTNGFVFTNWFGGSNLPLAPATNSPALTFVMRSNLILQAVFLDVQNPTVTITNPLPGGTPPGLAATVSGTATDNDQVVAVMFRLNNGSWAGAAGTNPWSASFKLAVGANTFSVYSVDAAGNSSTTNTIDTLVALPGAEIGGLTVVGGGITIGFPSEVGAVYRLECKNSLEAPAWTVLGVAVEGTGGVLSLTDTNPPAESRYYRLRAETP